MPYDVTIKAKHAGTTPQSSHRQEMVAVLHARAHRQNRGKAMTEAEAGAFVETKRRARALRRARPYIASRP
jgi:hypothetical protein